MINVTGQYSIAHHGTDYFCVIYKCNINIYIHIICIFLYYVCMPYFLSSYHIFSVNMLFTILTKLDEDAFLSTSYSLFLGTVYFVHFFITLFGKVILLGTSLELREALQESHMTVEWTLLLLGISLLLLLLHYPLHVPPPAPLLSLSVGCLALNIEFDILLFYEMKVCKAMVRS